MSNILELAPGIEPQGSHWVLNKIIDQMSCDQDSIFDKMSNKACHKTSDVYTRANTFSVACKFHLYCGAEGVREDGL